eukprot:TRINITY_DN7246_c0_g1_i2.p1 TRINITY_DN7246_c0_g1~~TRINITY_DN7246_c0_g1_i2.p1  ORF type:complete len:3099 (+),score=817.41 TRINITY_DN7246_c0_g1_i2:4292-13588(+)
MCDSLLSKYDEAMGKLVRKAALPSIDALFESTQYIRESASSQATVSSSFVLARYKVDFGSIVRGTTRKRTIRMWNTGVDNVSFQVDKRVLHNTGVAFDPEKVAKLPGIPDCAYQDVEITFNTKQKGIVGGPFSMTIPILVRGGPRINIEICASIVVPTIQLTSEKLDFGRVWLGRCRAITVGLRNPNELPCDFTCPIKDGPFAKNFVCEPSNGTILPKAWTQISIKFMPQEARNMTHKIPIRVQQSPHAFSITCRGVGTVAEFEIEPPELSPRPILPFSVVFEKFRVVNPSTKDLQVFMPAYDQQYFDEEEVIRSVGTFENGIMLIDAREAGNPLPSSLLEKYKDLKDAEAAALKNEEESDENEENVAGEETEAVGEVGVGEIVDETGKKDTSVNLIVHGPSKSGKTSLARVLGEKYSIPILCLDSMVMSILQNRQHPLWVPLASFLAQDPEEGGDEEGKVTLSDSEDIDIKDMIHPRPLSSDLLSQVLQSRLSLEDCGRGVIFDGLDGVYASGLVDFASALKQSFPLKKFGLCLLYVRPERADLRNASQEEAEKVCLYKDAKIEIVNEDVYESMDEVDQIAYNENLKLARKLKSEVDAARSLKQAAAMKCEEAEKTDWRRQMDEQEAERKRQIEAHVAEATQKTDARKGRGKKEEVVPVVPEEEPLPEDPIERSFVEYQRARTELMKMFSPPQVEGGENGEVVDGLPEDDKGKEDAPSDDEVLPVDKGTFLELDGNIPLEDLVSSIEQSIALPERVSKASDDEETIELPPPRMFEVLHDPGQTRQSTPGSYPSEMTYFQVVRRKPKPGVEDEDGEPKGDDKDESVPLEETLTDDMFEVCTRILVRANSSEELFLRFFADHTGEYSDNLKFVATGTVVEKVLSCSGYCAFPSISDEPRSVFYRTARARPSQAGKYVQKQYVLSDKVFDFGPLLIGKSGEDAPEEMASAFVSNFRITNTGVFPCNVILAFSNSSEDTPFVVEPESIHLEKDETKEITVSAYPSDVGSHENTLVCLIDDNPFPVTFPLACLGTKPEISLDVTDIDFERLLRGSSDSKEITIRNTSALPIQWKVQNAEDVPESFTVIPVSGSLAPTATMPLHVDFQAGASGVSEVQLKLQVADSFGAFDSSRVAQEVVIRLKGESYEIDVDCELPGDGHINFGTVKVGGQNEQVFSMQNKNPKYEVGFRFTMRRRVLEEYFRIEPMEGVLAAAQKDKTQVRLQFKTVSEVSFTGCKDIICEYTDPGSGDVLGSWNLDFSVSAVFSKYSIMPLYGLNFGPLVSGSEKTRRFELRNEGEFPFEFRLAAPPDATRPVSTTPDSGAPKGKPAAKGKPAKGPSAAGGLQVGRFSVHPPSGTVQPGKTQDVNVVFQADGAAVSSESVVVDISERDPHDHPDGIPYPLEGESCIPSINVSDFLAVFEEQQVLSSLEPDTECKSIFVEDRRVFYFGNLLVGESACERFKLSNPNKVPCTVKVQLKAKDGQEAFKVVPNEVTIPPHEHRYAEVTFSPTQLQDYSAHFEASVVDEGAAKARELSFEIRGDSTLPHVEVVEPSARGESGIVMTFPRCFVGKRVNLPIRVRNAGLLPASVRLSLRGDDAFALSGEQGQADVPVGDLFETTVSFEPQEAGTFEGELHVNVAKNSYEITVIHVSGESFFEEVAFDDLPEDEQGTLTLGDVSIGSRKQISFTMQNHSKDVVRFQWKSPLDIVEVVPKIGHILAQNTKTIVVNFTPDKAIDLTTSKMHLECNMTKIVYTEDVESVLGMDWDAAKKIVRWVNEEDTALSSPMSARSAKCVEEIAPEPAHSVIPESEISSSLELVGSAEYPKFECSVSEIRFRPTLMFQTRSFTFTLENTGQSSLPVEAFVMDVDGDEDDAPDRPFIVVPSTVEIVGGDSCEFSVRFSPKDVDTHRRTLLLNIPHLPEGVEAPQISLYGTSQCPVVHFEVQFSDYLRSGRRPPELPGPGGVHGPLDPATKAVEIESRGVQVRNTKRFYLLNPTNGSYAFEWVCHDVSTKSPFRCVTPRGIVQSGKKFEIIFEYLPTSVETHESFWEFTIQSHKLSVPFLLVGRTAEPSVVLDRGHVNFRALLVGHRALQVVNIVNSEMVPLPFSFDKSGFETGGGRSVLSIQPSSGTVPPRGRAPIEVAFSPHSEESYNFNVLCHVKRMSRPLSLNVKGDAFKVHEALTIESTDGKEVVDIAPQSRNYVDFGRVHVNEEHRRIIRIDNRGKYDFDFNWTIPPSTVLSLSPATGTVKKGESSACELVFSPTAPVALDGLKAVCTITNGEKYVVFISGVGSRALLSFSFMEHDFGAHFLYHHGMEPPSVPLLIVNGDSKDVSFDVLFENKPHLEVKAAASVLRPHEHREVLIQFYPREARSYEEVIPFEINGLYTVNVRVKGEGTPARVELANPALQVVNFGSLRVGETARKVVRLVNRSKIPAEVSMEEFASSLEPHFIRVYPLHPIVLPPRGQGDIDLTFAPHSRIRTFNVDLKVSIAGMPRNLVRLVGAAQGVEVKIEPRTIGFGPVVEKTSVSQRVVIENSGDLGIQFAFDKRRYSDFSIIPESGYLAPHTDVALDVVFAPGDLLHGESHSERLDTFTCMIEGSLPLDLKVSGVCVGKPPVQETLSFNVPVRKTTTKKVVIKNGTQKPWNVRPVFDNDMWTGESSVSVPAQGQVEYEVIYHPLAMTKDGEHHKGTLFIPLGDGSAMLFALDGTALPPSVENAGAHQIDVRAKSTYVHSIPVRNWLKQPQRFTVSMELQKDGATQIKGLDYMDVPAMIERNYKMSIFAYKEGVTSGKVMFRNEETGEYLTYEVSFRHGPPSVIQALQMESPVRKVTSYPIKIENPLEIDAAMAFSCDSSEVYVDHSPITIPAGEEAEIVVHYRPIVVQKSSAKIQIQSPELGLFLYEAQLVAVPAGPERSLHFHVALGNSASQSARFLHFLRAPCEYTIKLENPSFVLAQKTVKAPAATGAEGVEVEVPLQFQPSLIGDSNDVMVVSSPQGGEYVFMLSGQCVGPKPQGPFEVKSGASVNIPFINVFDAPVKFSFHIDNPSFQVKPGDQLPPKKPTTIPVMFKPVDSSKAGSMGKLVVSCENGPSWIFYLKGTSTSTS